MATIQYWLMKSEPDVYSIDDLKRDKRECWEGVRNFQARNFMRGMQVGDLAIFYHSNAKPPGAAGIARIARVAYPDSTQFDSSSKYYDPKSTPDKPRWSMVDVAFVEKFSRMVPLAELKSDPELEGMRVIQKGSRLSVQPVEKSHFERVIALSKLSRGAG